MLPENINSPNLNSPNLNFRVKFEKTGTAKYISHLDLNRLFARSIARAGIKLAHSEGFNPHPKLVFASTLSLGLESFCEFADIKIIAPQTTTASEIFNRLQSVFPTGINILEVYETENAFKNFKDIDKTRFHIFIKPDGFEIDEIDKLFEQDVFFEKKPGVIINLKDYICEMTISGAEREYKFIDIVLKTSQDMFLNPENIIKAISEKYNVEDYFIQKIEMYDKNSEYYKNFI